MRRSPDAARPTDPYRELARLSAETAARIEAGDDAWLDEALARRDTLLATIRTITVRPEDAENVRAAIGDVLALDEQLLAVLETHRRRVRDELAQIAGARTALQGYRGGVQSSAAYVDRLS